MLQIHKDLLLFDIHVKERLDTGEVKHTMPYDYDYVRLFSEKKIEYNDGFHGIHPVNILGVFRDENISELYSATLFNDSISTPNAISYLSNN